MLAIDSSVIKIATNFRRRSIKFHFLELFPKLLAHFQDGKIRTFDVITCARKHTLSLTSWFLERSSGEMFTANHQTSKYEPDGVAWNTDLLADYLNGQPMTFHANQGLSKNRNKIAQSFCFD
jgi:hypothetical protein